jgi:unsaturated rhamnogalacturonyl hydrolase
MTRSILTILLFLNLFVIENTTAVITEPYSKRMADAQMARSGAQITWDYPNGLFVESVLKVYEMYGGSAYFNYALNYAKATVNSTTGKIGSKYKFTDYTLDNINPGMFLLDIYNRTFVSQYKTALDTLRKQLQMHPRTSEGGFWHKYTYPNQMWLDGIYMGSRFYAAYEKQFDNGQYYDDVVNQFTVIHSHTYDPVYQLSYHAWSATPTDVNSFWSKQSDPFKGCSPEFWARGMGWYAAALVDVLEVLPAGYAKRQELLDILNQVAAGIKRWQDPLSGCWFQLLRYDNTVVSNGKLNYLEASASSMFTYAILKAVRLGLISKADYQSVGTKAYQGLITKFITEDASGNLSMNQICSSAGLGPASNPSRDGSVNYYLNGSDAGLIVTNDLKGVGPFILASVEYEKLQLTTTGNDLIINSQNDYQIKTNNNKITIQSIHQNLSEVSFFNIQGEELFQWNGPDLAEVTMYLPYCQSGMYLLQINGCEYKKVFIRI